MNNGNIKNSAKNGHITPSFNPIESIFEKLFFKKRRKILWNKVSGEHLLEIGVGKGKNFSYYPSDTKITALDFNQEMLKLARRQRRHEGAKVEIVLMDVQSLCYADNSFDTIVSTFSFCSVSKPIKGLQELYRVCKPGGQVLLLENVLSSNPIKVFFMRIINPLIVFTFGININRKTIKYIKACGFRKVIVDSASSDTIKIIQAIK